MLSRRLGLGLLGDGERWARARAVLEARRRCFLDFAIGGEGGLVVLRGDGWGRVELGGGTKGRWVVDVPSRFRNAGDCRK